MISISNNYFLIVVVNIFNFEKKKENTITPYIINDVVNSPP